MALSVRTRGGTVAAGLAAVLLAGAVGCSAGTDESPEMEPAAAVAAAARNADDIKTFEYRMKGSVPGQGKVTGTASMSVEPLAMSMRMTVDGATAEESGEVEIRLVGKAMYLGGGAEAAEEMDGRSWLKFDMSALDQAGGADSAGLGAAQAERNPAAESAFMTGAEDVEKVGTESVDGVRTTHYRGTVSLDDLRAGLKDEDARTRERRESSIDRYEDLGVETMTMDMWVDGEHHTKQFRMRGDADQGPLDLTITFLAVNEPVKVTAPPAKDTMDLAEMMGELGES
ncbi:DUF1396 domain-containing protein [Streptomyces sp. NPDC006458]|uniref:DUF1396 domain-containing protein n=1 Tax=Streptomyces sp. NPDC006458 TaxID=3154302 RepID=UPI0033B1B019